MLLERTAVGAVYRAKGLLLVDQARTVLRGVKVLQGDGKPARRDDVRPAWFNQQLVPWPLRFISNVAPDFAKLEMYLHEAQTRTSC